MKQYNLSEAIDKGRLLSKIYAELLKLTKFGENPLITVRQTVDNIVKCPLS